MPDEPLAPHDYRCSGDCQPCGGTGGVEMNTCLSCAGSGACHGCAPAPGSDEAIVAGCWCPVIDNEHGRGYLGDGMKYGWWTAEGCPIHAGPIEEMTG